MGNDNWERIYIIVCLILKAKIGAYILFSEILFVFFFKQCQCKLTKHATVGKNPVVGNW